jgi:hypothetical protein
LQLRHNKRIGHHHGQKSLSGIMEQCGDMESSQIYVVESLQEELPILMNNEIQCPIPQPLLRDYSKLK